MSHTGVQLYIQYSSILGNAVPVQLMIRIMSQELLPALYAPNRGKSFRRCSMYWWLVGGLSKGNVVHQVENGLGCARTRLRETSSGCGSRGEGRDIRGRICFGRF